MNNWSGVGNIGNIKELKFLQNGTGIFEFSLATRGYKGATDWHNITVMGKSAENCAKYLNKGSKVSVKGKLQYSKWEDDKGKHERAYILADGYDGVEFLDSKNSESKTNNSSQQTELEEVDSDLIPF